MNLNENQVLLEQYTNLRVADVRDGMDVVFRHHSASMEPSIRPLFRTRAWGIARTVRYIPFQGALPWGIPEEKYYQEWIPNYYRTICPYPWIEQIQEGDFIVIDQSEMNVGLMGSENTLNCIIRGARGFVSNGGVRDTDEIIHQKIPFWSRYISQANVIGRLQFDSMGIPVSVGGITVYPGDVVVADGDGIIVVPRDIALEVARYAHKEHEQDKKTRKSHYQKLMWPEDETVR